MQIVRKTLVILITLVSRIHAAEVDPLTWIKPVEVPAFRDQLPPEEFQRRSKIVLERLGDLAKLALSPIPDRAVRVVRALPDGQAAEWKLKPDDLITKIDSNELWGSTIPSRDSQRRVTVYRSADKRFQIFNAKPGIIGVLSGSYWRPELSYLRTKPLRNPKWDEYVVVGASCCEADPDLAETAWFRATQMGYPSDGLSQICGAAIAFNQGRVETAADFAYFAREMEPGRAKFVSPQILMRVMLANYKLNDAFQLCQQYPQELSEEPDAFQILAKLHEKRSEVERGVMPPSQIAEDRYRDDLLTRSVSLTLDARNYLPKLLEGQGVTISSDNGHHIPLILLPSEPAHDLELTIRFTLISLHPGSNESQFKVGFIPYSSEGMPDHIHVPSHLKMGVDSLEGSRILLNLGIPSLSVPFDNPGYPLAPRRSQEIRVIRIGGQLEAFVDGKRVLYQPVDEDNVRLAAFVDSSASRVKIESFQLFELLKQ